VEKKPPAHRSIAGNESPLPAERAFVIQLRPQTDPADELFVGRVEHIASGAAARFASSADLIAFVASVLAPGRSDLLAISKRGKAI
jgi:hypothetical protein